MRLTTIAFLSTLAVTLPAGWSVIGAGAPDQGAAERPPVATMVSGDVTVNMTVDRASVEAGGAVHVTLVAMASSRQQTEVMVSVMEQTGSAESRMPSPPTVVERESMKLVAMPGGGHPRTLAFTLAGPTAQAYDDDGNVQKDPIYSAGQTAQYTIVLAPKGKESASVDGDGFVADNAAAVPVTVKAPEAYQLEVVASGRDSDGKYTASLRVTNVSKKTLRNINLSLSSNEIGFSATEDGSDTVATLAPGASKTIQFVGEGSEETTATVDLTAYGYAEYGGSSQVVGKLVLRDKVQATRGGETVSQARRATAPGADDAPVADQPSAPVAAKTAAPVVAAPAVLWTAK